MIKFSRLISICVHNVRYELNWYRPLFTGWWSALSPSFRLTVCQQTAPFNVRESIAAPLANNCSHFDPYVEPHCQQSSWSQTRSPDRVSAVAAVLAKRLFGLFITSESSKKKDSHSTNNRPMIGQNWHSGLTGELLFVLAIDNRTNHFPADVNATIPARILQTLCTQLVNQCRHFG